MYRINTSNNVPDSTYFTSSDVSPEIEGNTITIWNGKGSRRSWGAPNVTSTVVINHGKFAAIHVGFSHKHRGGQGWYYFVNGERQTWAQLSDKLRTKVLDNVKKAPVWAKTPGTLKAERKAPSSATKHTAYKLVEVVGDQFFSLYNDSYEYELGKRMTQKAQDNHNGGFYAYPTIEQALSFKSARIAQGKTLAVIEVECSGNIVKYENGKFAATFIKPVKVVANV